VRVQSHPIDPNWAPAAITNIRLVTRVLEDVGLFDVAPPRVARYIPTRARTLHPVVVARRRDVNQLVRPRPREVYRYTIHEIGYFTATLSLLSRRRHAGDRTRDAASLSQSFYRDRRAPSARERERATETFVIPP